MKHTIRMAAVALATGAAFAAAAASPAVAAPSALAAQSVQAKAYCHGTQFTQKENGQTYIVGKVTFCDSKDKVIVNDIDLDGRSLGVRISDGSGTYRYCKDSNGAGDRYKTCYFNLKENRQIKLRGYESNNGHRTAWLQTVTFPN
ncbi:hypothetical protein AB0C93_30355 [Streptomyces sp. NPDC048518]|uniref:hypothetical protein n=1 Tax=Streptomyces sp. NPDC048518 TaxID=3155029 RepID=UPI0033D92B13